VQRTFCVFKFSIQLSSHSRACPARPSPSSLTANELANTGWRALARKYCAWKIWFVSAASKSQRHLEMWPDTCTATIGLLINICNELTSSFACVSGSLFAAAASPSLEYACSRPISGCDGHTPGSVSLEIEISFRRKDIWRLDNISDNQ
jgi:hypothetical protein